MLWLLRVALLTVLGAGLVNTLPYRESVHPSQRLFTFIKEVEGLRLEAYGDGAIGYGHTKVALGTVISAEYAETLLREDVRRVSDQVLGMVGVPMTQWQLDAMVSITYNVGPSKIASSNLLKQLNAGNYADTHKEFLRWVYSGGVRKVGLVNRRRREIDLFKGL